jgi:hypothetical protein
MLDQIAIFLILVLLWIGARFVLMHWLWNAIGRGTVSQRTGQLLFAAMLGTLPLLALPWVLWAWPYLLAAGIVLFLVQLAISGAYLAFLRRNP